jgi:hypothetical protein
VHFISSKEGNGVHEDTFAVMRHSPELILADNVTAMFVTHITTAVIKIVLGRH